MDNNRFILAGDIGGTKSNIGVFMVSSDRLTPVKVLNFVNAEYSGIDDIINASLSHELDLKYKDDLQVAVLGLAGYVKGDSASLTNLGWKIDAESIKERFNIGRVSLINDLSAAGLGLALLDRDRDIYTLQEGTEGLGGTATTALISAGTGLGEVALFHNGFDFVPLPSEGGHADFAPTSEIEIELLLALRAKFGHVSYERLVSGAGLVNIYDFVKNKRLPTDSSASARPKAGQDMPEWITAEALGGRDEICFETLGIFLSIFGAEAGNLALRSLSLGGLYIGGGIAPKILDAIKSGGFMNAFLNKGRLRGFLSRIGVHVITNQATPLMGAARLAANIMGKIE